MWFFLHLEAKMKKEERVKDNILFNDIIKKGLKLQNKYFIIYYKDNNLEKSRFGIAAGKKLGNAVTRNKQKRRIRMLLGENKKLFEKNRDYIIIIKEACLKAKFDILQQEIKNIMK